jgi:hypothetical protein
MEFAELRIFSKWCQGGHDESQKLKRRGIWDSETLSPNLQYIVMKSKQQMLLQKSGCKMIVITCLMIMVANVGLQGRTISCIYGETPSIYVCAYRVDYMGVEGRAQWYE